MSGTVDREELIEAVTREVLAALAGTSGDACRDCLGSCAAHSPDKVRAVVAGGAERIAYHGNGADVPRDLARYIDHTLLRPDATADDIDRLCGEAKEYGFAAVCINPTWIRRAAANLRGATVAVASVVGFPFGATTSDVKATEARRALRDGASEIDMVINIGALKSGMRETVRLINRAIVAAGGPADLVTAVAEPTIESARALMNHPDVGLLLVTGGPGVVREALKTDKRAVAAGPGNPPAVVDQTADVERAGRDIVRVASFDNNLVCTDEKVVIVVDSVADRLVRAMTGSGAYLLKEHELRRLERVIFTELGAPGKHGVINPRWIGQDASKILAAIGVQVDREVRLAIAEVSRDHSLVWTEQMLPVLPIVRVGTVDQAIELAVRAEHGFRHTASIHSTNVETITRMARAMNCSIFVANGPNYAGLGEGGQGFASFSIATPTGDGLTRPRTFSRERRITVVGSLRIV